MGEGVDPTQMCQSLVDKVAQSKQLLLAITDPALLVLFDDWLEELEDAVIEFAGNREHITPEETAQKIRFVVERVCLYDFETPA